MFSLDFGIHDLGFVIFRDFEKNSFFSKFNFFILSGTLKVKLGTKHFKIFQMLSFEKNQLKRRDELSRIYLLDESRRDSNLTAASFFDIFLPRDCFKHILSEKFPIKS